MPKLKWNYLKSYIKLLKIILSYKENYIINIKL